MQSPQAAAHGCLRSPATLAAARRQSAKPEPPPARSARYYIANLSIQFQFPNFSPENFTQNHLARPISPHSAHPAPLFGTAPIHQPARASRPHSPHHLYHPYSSQHLHSPQHPHSPHHPHHPYSPQHLHSPQLQQPPQQQPSYKNPGSIASIKKKHYLCTKSYAPLSATE